MQSFYLPAEKNETVFTGRFSKVRTFALHAFFSKNIFLKSQLKVENSFLKLCKNNAFKVKLAIYRLIKRKLKKYLTVFVGGRFSVLSLFLTQSKPEVDKKLRIPRCPLR